MPGPFRFYVKKRGDRRTGSQAFGSILMGLFFAVFFFFGLTFASLALTRYVIPEWRVNHVFVETECEVLNTRVKQVTEGATLVFRPDIEIRYTAGDVTFTGWTYDIAGVFSPGLPEKEAIIHRFVPGQRYPCWYDPSHPSQAVVVRGYTWASWLMLLLPVAFLVIGGGGLIYSFVTWGKSAEHRAATAGLPVSRELLQNLQINQSDFRTVPQGTSLTDSPGTKLRFRLPVRLTNTWWLLVTLGVALTVNAVVAVFVWMTVRGHLRGVPDWRLTIFTLPWILVAGATAWHALRQLLIQTGIGPTILEISDHPIYPGERYSVMLSQGGRLAVNNMRLLLVCVERATYQQGTNTRTDGRKVFQMEVFCGQDFHVESGRSFETTCEFELPRLAMHSFKAEYNQIDWSFVVQGNLAAWPDFQRGFPVIVYPARESKASA